MKSEAIYQVGGWLWVMPHGSCADGVGHSLQSMPGEIFTEAHFHMIAEQQTSQRAEGDMEI